MLTRGLAECLWCASYAYYVFRLEIEKHVGQGGSLKNFEMSAAQGGHVEVAMKVLRAALLAASHGEGVDWTDLPKPVSPSSIAPNSSLESKVGEMALSALCFVLHHEFAHIRLGHAGTDSSQPSWTLEQEKDADSEAIQWILGNASKNEMGIAKRMWGMVITTVFMTAKRLAAITHGVSPASVKEQTHPQPYDRLDKAIQHHIVQESPLLRETMTSLACVALIPHIRIANVPIGKGPYEDYPELYQVCLDALAKTLAL